QRISVLLGRSDTIRCGTAIRFLLALLPRLERAMRPAWKFATMPGTTATTSLLNTTDALAWGESMRAITFNTPGDPEVLQLTEVPDPTPGPEQLLVRVRASALNRADTLQRRGQYPPPPGESDILGLELAGEVEAIGPAAQGFRVGDRVFGLVGGGGYA